MQNGQKHVLKSYIKNEFKISCIEQVTVILLLISGFISRPDRLEYALEFAGKNRTELEKVYVTSNYLIRNIEMSFREWQERPWNTHCS